MEYMSKIIATYLKRMHQIHENCPMRTNPLWATKILYEYRRDDRRDGTDIQRDIIHYTEQIEPDKTKWDISVEDYREAIANLLKQYPKMKP